MLVTCCSTLCRPNSDIASQYLDDTPSIFLGAQGSFSSFAVLCVSCVASHLQWRCMRILSGCVENVFRQTFILTQGVHRHACIKNCIFPEIRTIEAGSEGNNVQMFGPLTCSREQFPLPAGRLRRNRTAPREWQVLLCWGGNI